MEIIKDSIRSNEKTLSGNHTDDMDKMEKDTQQEKEMTDRIIMRHLRRKPTYITEGKRVKKRHIGPNRAREREREREREYQFNQPIERQ